MLAASKRGGTPSIQEFAPRRRRAVVALCAVLSVLAFSTAPADSAPRVSRHAVRSAEPQPHVYLMRGLMNVFSLGMDELAAKIQSRGIAASVYNHAQAGAVVATITARYRAGDRGPVILIGHSLGADAVMQMARALDVNGVPVALVIPFDGTMSFTAPKNVASVVNLTQREYAYMRPGSGFHGALQNVDVSGDPGIDHITIDKSPRMQAIALSHVLRVVAGASRRPPAGTATRPRTQEPAPAAAAPQPLRGHVDVTMPNGLL